MSRAERLAYIAALYVVTLLSVLALLLPDGAGGPARP